MLVDDDGPVDPDLLEDSYPSLEYLRRSHGKKDHVVVVLKRRSDSTVRAYVYGPVSYARAHAFQKRYTRLATEGSTIVQVSVGRLRDFKDAHKETV